MIIKSHKEYHIYFLISSVLITTMAVAIYCEFKNIIIPLIVLFLNVMIFCQWISIGKTLIMDKNGCMVRFLIFKKVYRWSDFKVKCLVDCHSSYGYRIPYKKCVIFSKKGFKSPQWLHPVMYGAFHPFEFLFVCFKELDCDRICSDIYLIDENEFLNKMSKWNVEIVDERD